MNLSPELRDALRAALAEVLGEVGGDAVHDLAHADRVWENARGIAGGEGHEASPVLMAAAYLHDLVSYPPGHPDRTDASRLSATAAGPVMEALGFAPREIAAARHIIEAHSHLAGLEPLSTEARILADAERLEALGAMGIARTLMVAGQAGMPLFHAEDPLAVSRPLDGGAFAVDLVRVRHAAIPRAMHTQTGRRLAMARVGAMQDWLQGLSRELCGAT